MELAPLLLAAAINLASAPPALPTEPTDDPPMRLVLEFPVSRQAGWVEIQSADFSLSPPIWQFAARYDSIGDGRAPCDINVDWDTFRFKISCWIVIEDPLKPESSYDKRTTVFRVRECWGERPGPGQPTQLICEPWKFEPGERRFKP